VRTREGKFLGRKEAKRRLRGRVRKKSLERKAGRGEASWPVRYQVRTGVEGGLARVVDLEGVLTPKERIRGVGREKERGGCSEEESDR